MGPDGERAESNELASRRTRSRIGRASALNPVSRSQLTANVPVATGHPSPLHAIRPWIAGETVPAAAIEAASTSSITSRVVARADAFRLAAPLRQRSVVRQSR